MRPEHRGLIACLVILIATPFLFEAGERLEGDTLGVLLPALAVLAAFLYARKGETERERHLP